MRIIFAEFWRETRSASSAAHLCTKLWWKLGTFFGNVLPRLDGRSGFHMAKDSSGSATETKRSRFVRLAESRTSNAIRAIRTIAKLGNRTQYEFDENDIRKIAAALSKEIDAMRARMTQPNTKENVDFKL